MNRVIEWAICAGDLVNLARFPYMDVEVAPPPAQPHAHAAVGGGQNVGQVFGELLPRHSLKYSDSRLDHGKRHSVACLGIVLY